MASVSSVSTFPLLLPPSLPPSPSAPPPPSLGSTSFFSFSPFLSTIHGGDVGWQRASSRHGGGMGTSTYGGGKKKKKVWLFSFLLLPGRGVCVCVCVRAPLSSLSFFFSLLSLNRMVRGWQQQQQQRRRDFSGFAPIHTALKLPPAFSSSSSLPLLLCKPDLS